MLEDILREMERCRLEVRKPNPAKAANGFSYPRNERADEGDIRITNMQELANLYRQVDHDNLERIEEEFLDNLPTEDISTEDIDNEFARREAMVGPPTLRCRLGNLGWRVSKWIKKIPNFFRSLYHTSAMVIFGRPTFLQKESNDLPDDVAEILVDMEECEITNKPPKFYSFVFNLPYRRGGLVGWVKRKFM